MSWPLGYTSLPLLASGTASKAWGISGDGIVVVGEAEDSGGNQLAVKWTQSSGPTDLGFLPGGNFAIATGTNQDGSVIVGQSNIGGGGSVNYRGFRWTSGGGMVTMAPLPNPSETNALSVSSDGAVVVGYAVDSVTAAKNAAHWNASGTLTALPFLTGGTQAQALAANSDGSIIVGQCDSTSDSQTHAVYWQGGAIHDLGYLGVGDTFSAAYGVSSDGSVIVGESDNASFKARAFRWTSGGGMQNLGLLPGGTYAYAIGVSGDGTRVIGVGDNSTGTQVVWVWTSGTGMVALGDPPGLAVDFPDNNANWLAINNSALVGWARTIIDPGNGQHPAHYATTGTTAYCTLPNQTLFAAPLTTAVASWWLHDAQTISAFQTTITDTIGNPNPFYTGDFGLNAFNNFFIGFVHQNSPGTLIQFQGSASGTFPTDCAVNVLISFDLTVATQRLQVYVNDVAWVTVIGPNDGVSPPTFPSTTSFQNSTGNNVAGRNGYIADYWFGSTGSFVDLSIEANRRKFINADLTPVALGSNGQNPFGSSPEIYQNMATAGALISEWFTNKGSTGGTFSASGGSITNDGDPCIVEAPVGWVYGLESSPVTTRTIGLSEMFFTPTAGFVDITDPANQAKLATDAGCTVGIGTHGTGVFGIAPSVFFNQPAGSTANLWATNEGTGGAFILTGSLTAATGPCCGPGQININNQPEPVTVYLRWSDTRGKTYGNPMGQTMGAPGEYYTVLQWNRLGLARDRVYELFWSAENLTTLQGAFLDPPIKLKS